ncbi:glycosyltransferase family 2 protein [Desulfovibrio sp. TomC]|uniref:glycosyltransferase family 2 protein n=1 Tax=Desulfovibrio sp. TomC TaxID=1562888 RepID=UPI0005759B2D|nr:glycosyltransferase family 2 protein [Desulfovibrio sp. TomC]KHK00149.1 Glycosyltransferase [Desulfovibrio sp. TomC]
MPLISVVTPCYNEEANVHLLYEKIRLIFSTHFPDYDYEHIYIDNASRDTTVALIKQLCTVDKRVKLIVNARNFGHIRSPFYGMLQARGDAVVLMASDLQDPPEVLVDFIRQWEAGYKLVLAIKKQEINSPIMGFIRKKYYQLLEILSDVSITKDFTGFGLYDRIVIEELRALDDAYPYLRGIISELGHEAALVEFIKPPRHGGITHNNFYTLYDMAMLGITNHSKIPLRLATMFGFAMSAISILVAIGYLIYKILFWDVFALGMAPIIVGMFFLGSVQLFFLGIVGEYVGSIHTQVLARPLVIEKERVNLD